MNISRHASIRQRQRGFSDFVMKIIFRYGKSVNAPGNVTRIFFSDKDYQQVVSELKKAIQLLDKAKGGQMIVSGDQIFTVYK
jgi:hypothetical protein